MAEEAYCPQNLSKPGLSGCSELMGTSQSPEPRRPNRKVAGGSRRARQTEIKWRAGQSVWRPTGETQPRAKRQGPAPAKTQVKVEPRPQKESALR